MGIVLGVSCFEGMNQKSDYRRTSPWVAAKKLGAAARAGARQF